MTVGDVLSTPKANELELRRALRRIEGVSAAVLQTMRRSLPTLALVIDAELSRSVGWE